jgi:hypothetical protein
MTALAEQTMTENQYLEFEKTSQARHEFVNGQLIAMAGETRQHHRLARRVLRLLEEKAEQKGCEIALEGIKVRTRDASTVILMWWFLALRATMSIISRILVLSLRLVQLQIQILALNSMSTKVFRV